MLDPTGDVPATPAADEVASGAEVTTADADAWEDTTEGTLGLTANAAVE